MDKIKFVELALLSVFSVWIYREYISIFLTRKTGGKVFGILKYIPWILYFQFNLKSLYYFWTGSGYMFLYMIGCLIYFTVISAAYYEKKDRWYTLFLNVVIAVCWMSVVIILVYIFRALGIKSQNEPQFQYWYFICVFSQFLMLAIIKIVQLKAKSRSEFQMSDRYFIISLCTTVGTIFVIYNIYILQPYISDRRILVMSIISVLLMIGINLLNYYNFQNYSESLNTFKNNLLYQRQMNDYMFQCQRQEEMFRQINEINHNIKNHLISIRQFAEQGQPGRIEKYIEQLLDSEFKSQLELVKTGNYVIDALINEKYSRAKQNGADFSVEAFIPPDMPFADGDLALILGNALDNAVEAVETAPVKQITVKLVYSKMIFKIEICNTYDGKISLGNKKEIRTKKRQAELHGVGLPTIRHAVEKYDGELSIDYDDKWFKLVAILYAPEE